MCLSFVVGAQLKSVAHMPWRAMVYKSLGTFIDDLFAFVIKMPWMHRLSCLRDDLIFFIFLYQARRSFGTHTHRARAPNTSAQAREGASERHRSRAFDTPRGVLRWNTTAARQCAQQDQGAGTRTSLARVPRGWRSVVRDARTYRNPVNDRTSSPQYRRLLRMWSRRCAPPPQRWIYPVDKLRINEFGQVTEEFIENEQNVERVAKAPRLVSTSAGAAADGGDSASKGGASDEGGGDKQKDARRETDGID